MSLRSGLLLAVAFSAAGLTGLLTFNWLDAQRAAYAARKPQEVTVTDPLATVDILVAAVPLPTGTLVQADHLAWETWPEKAIADGHAVRGDAEEADFVGAVVRNHMMPGEPISATRVVHPGEQGFLAAVLQSGMRAVSVPVDAATGIAGLVFPGDRVDVIVTFEMNTGSKDDQHGRNRHFSETLVSGVRVLAVDQTIDNTSGSAMPAKTVTLEVDRKQAEKLALGLELGALSLALRSLVAEVTDADRGEHATSRGKEEDGPSYTRDIDALFVLRDTRVGDGSEKTRPPVQVLHGLVAEEVVF